MRLFPVLAIALVVAFAGCAKKNDDGGATTTTTTTPTTSTTSSTSTTTTSSSTTSTTPTTNTTPTTPTTPPPMDLCKLSFDYSTNQPDPANQGFTPTKKACGTVATGYTAFALNGTFSATTPVIVGQSIDLKIVGADGKTAIATCAANAGDAPPVKCTKSGTITAGDYSVIYEGGGAVTFSGTLSIS